MQEVVGDRSAQAGRGGNDPLAVALKDFHVDPGPIVEPLERSDARHLEEVAVPLVVLRQQQEVVRLSLTLGNWSLCEVGLHPDDRVNACLHAGVVPIHRCIHHAVIGDRHVRHSELLRSAHVLVDSPHTVEKRILGVKMQVSKFVHAMQAFRGIWTEPEPLLPMIQGVRTSSLFGRADNGAGSADANLLRCLVITCPFGCMIG